MAHRGGRSVIVEKSESSHSTSPFALPSAGHGKKRRKRILRYCTSVRRSLRHPLVLFVSLVFIVSAMVYLSGGSDILGELLSLFGGYRPKNLVRYSRAQLGEIKKLKLMKIVTHGPCVHAQDLLSKRKGNALVEPGTEQGMTANNRSESAAKNKTNTGTDTIQGLGVYYSVPLLRFSRGHVFRFAPSRDFDDLYQELWMSKSYRMKYSLKQELKVKTLKGSGGYVVQYVQGRSKRPFNPATEKIQVVQPFTHDEAVFNFMKSPLEEVLFSLRPFDVPKERDKYFGTGIPLPDVEKQRHSILECQQFSAPHQVLYDWRNELGSVIVNSHPFAYGCGVVLVRPSSKLPQVVTREALEVAFLLAVHSAEGLRVGYNSLGGGASVNHLHFQTWYFNSTEDGLMAIERAKTSFLREYSTFGVSQVEGYPLPAMVFTRKILAPSQQQGDGEVIPSAIAEELDAIYNCLFYMLKNNIPHNIIITAHAERVFLIPRQEQTPTRFEGRLGFPEVGGQLIVVSREMFDAFSVDADAEEFISSVGMTSEAFTKLTNTCLK